MTEENKEELPQKVVALFGEMMMAEDINNLEDKFDLDDVEIIARFSNDRIQVILANEVLRLNGRRPYIPPKEPELEVA